MKATILYDILFISLAANLGLLLSLIRYRQRNRVLLHKSSVDELTGLYNRYTCIDEIDRCLRLSGNTGHQALFLIDLDNFKHINDTYGHKTGDEVLKLLSRLMGQQFHCNAILGRWGGDEFLIFLKHASNTGQVERGAKRLCHAVEQAVKNAKHPFTVSISIGIVMVRPDDDFSVLMQKADNALYYVKNHGKNNYHIVE